MLFRSLLSSSNDGDVITCYERSKLCLYTLNGKLLRQAIFEEETIQVKIFENEKINSRLIILITIISIEFGHE